MQHDSSYRGSKNKSLSGSSYDGHLRSWTDRLPGMVGTDFKTVGNQRGLLTGCGEIPHVETVIDTLDRERLRSTKPTDQQAEPEHGRFCNATPHYEEGIAEMLHDRRLGSIC